MSDTATHITAKPITAASFAPFGDVIDASGDAYKWINQGACRRFTDLAKMDFADGHAGVSIFDARPRSLPYQFNLVERHPLGSQCFIPISQHPFLVIVAPDEGGVPGTPQAFVTQAGQAVNFHRGTWHGVLTPLHAPGLFAVVDRIAPQENPDPNLEEYEYVNVYTVKIQT